MKTLTLAVFLGGLAYAQLPPIIDRDAFFGEVEIAGAQISPDGNYVSFLKPYKGVRNLWVKKAEEPFSAARPLTAEAKRPIASYFWTRDAKFLLFTKDNDGDENYNVYAVDPAAAAVEATGVPPARDLTGVKGARVVIYALPKNQPDTVYLGLNDRDKAWHDLYRLSLSTGQKTLVRQNTDRVSAWVFDNKGDLRIATRSADNGDTEFLRVDAGKFTKVYSCSVLETCAPVKFDKENKQLYLITNQGASRDLIELALMDPASGATALVEADPQKRVDLAGVVFSDLTDELLGTVYLDERERLHWRDKTFEADYNWVKSKLGQNMQLGFGSRTRDENLWVVTASSDTEPGATYLFNRKAKKLDPLYKVREKLPREHLAAMQPMRYESSDGLEIPAYLTLPKGVPAKSLPVVILPHGGPWARDSWGYSGLPQFLANRGYAVLQMNFRGSTGYGKKFLDKGNGEWGRKMQDDVTWGVKALVQKGIADPKRVAIMGGSYGGYATLAGVTYTPDVYAAAVSIVGPSNLITLLDSIPPYWEAFRKTMYARMADPGTPEGKKRLEEMSPLNYAKNIKTPLMIMQGANDPRVNKAESEQIVIALRDRGFPVEYLLFPDEGHGFARPVNMLASMAAAEQFLSKRIGGRAQEGGTPEALARLKEVTVDVKTVSLAAKPAIGVVGLPKIAVPPPPGLDKYAAKIKLGAQEIALDLVTEIKSEGGKLVATDSMKTPMGEAKATAVLDPATLSVEKISVAQGPVNINVAYAGGKAEGEFKMGENAKPINVETGGALFADTAGTMQSIAALPLAEGYQTVYRNFDLQKQKTAIRAVKVVGAEQVTVPAGEFDTHKVEITSAEGGPEKTTLWISKKDRKAVRMETVMPQMNGAVMTAELQK